MKPLSFHNSIYKTHPLFIRISEILWLLLAVHSSLITMLLTLILLLCLLRPYDPTHMNTWLLQWVVAWTGRFEKESSKLQIWLWDLVCLHILHWPCVSQLLIQRSLQSLHSFRRFVLLIRPFSQIIRCLLSLWLCGCIHFLHVTAAIDHLPLLLHPARRKLVFLFRHFVYPVIGISWRLTLCLDHFHWRQLLTRFLFHVGSLSLPWPALEGNFLFEGKRLLLNISRHISHMHIQWLQSLLSLHVMLMMLLLFSEFIWHLRFIQHLGIMMIISG